MDFAALISDLKAKLATTIARAAKLTEQRRPYALAAVSGEAEAKRTIRKIDADVIGIRSDAETLEIAIEEAEKRKAEHDAQVAAEDRRRREAKAREICGAILEVDREFDKVAGLLHQALTNRERLVQDLTKLDVIYPGLTKALRRKRNINGALVHASLDQFADIEHVSPHGRMPLVQSDTYLNNPMMNNAVGDDKPHSNEAREEGAAA